MSLVAAVGGVLTLSLVVPLLVAVMAVTVVVLLVLPDSRASIRTQNPRHT